MSGFNSNFNLISVLPATTAAGSGRTSTVGNIKTAALSYTGSGVVVESVADITSPTAWTSLVSISGKGRATIAQISSTGNSIDIVVASTEDAGEAIRVQVVRDGVTIWDQTCTKDTSNTQQSLPNPIAAQLQIEFEESLVIKACRKGTFASATTSLAVGAITLETIE